MNEFLALHCCWSRIFLQLYALTNVNLLQIRGLSVFSVTPSPVFFIVTPSSCITSLVCTFFFTNRVSASFSKFSFFTSFLILRSSSISSYTVTPVREAYRYYTLPKGALEVVVAKGKPHSPTSRLHNRVQFYVIPRTTLVPL